MTTVQNPGNPQAGVQVRRAMSRLRRMLQQIRSEQARAWDRLAQVRPPQARTGATRRRDRAD